MKNTSNKLFATLSNGQLENLTHEVKETIAFEPAIGLTKTLTTADLWNIQRQVRTRVQRKFF